MVDYRTDPSRYRHWRLAFDGPIATLSMDVAEDARLEPGYKLKLNSYDLGVDIELADALNRIRFEHPEVRAVIVTSAKDRIFCSGANIFMLGRRQPCLEGELLQVHQRDEERHRGLVAALGTQVRRRGERYLRGRRLRDGARVRRDRAGGRPLLGRVAARGAAAGRAAGHRRAHPHDGQAQACATTTRTSSAPPPKGVRGAARGRLATGGRDRQARAIRGNSARPREEARAIERSPCRRARGRAAAAASASRAAT